MLTYLNPLSNNGLRGKKVNLAEYQFTDPIHQSQSLLLSLVLYFHGKKIVEQKTICGQTSDKIVVGYQWCV